MSIELRSAPDTTQRKIDVVSSAVKGQYGLVYSDDIEIVSNSRTKHMVHAREAHTFSTNEEVTLKPKTYYSFTETIGFCRQIM